MSTRHIIIFMNIPVHIYRILFHVITIQIALEQINGYSVQCHHVKSVRKQVRDQILCVHLHVNFPTTILNLASPALPKWDSSSHIQAALSDKKWTVSCAEHSACTWVVVSCVNISSRWRPPL